MPHYAGRDYYPLFENDVDGKWTGTVVSSQFGPILKMVTKYSTFSNAQRMLRQNFMSIFKWMSQHNIPKKVIKDGEIVVDTTKDDFKRGDAG